MFVKHHILALVLIPLCVLAAAASFYRFMVQEDFIVQYEGTCDPAIENCYVACEDDECTSVYYYTLIQKRAAEVYAACGPDITDCEDANICLDTDSICEIEHCDLSEDDCIGPGETLPEEDVSSDVEAEGEVESEELEPMGEETT